MAGENDVPDERIASDQLRSRIVKWPLDISVSAINNGGGIKKPQTKHKSLRWMPSPLNTVFLDLSDLAKSSPAAYTDIYEDM